MSTDNDGSKRKEGYKGTLGKKAMANSLAGADSKEGGYVGNV